MELIVFMHLPVHVHCHIQESSEDLFISYRVTFLRPHLVFAVFPHVFVVCKQMLRSHVISLELRVAQN